MNFHSQRLWGSGDSKASVTLCIFPHLEEFICIDARGGVPGRPVISTLRIGDVLDEEFYRSVEEDFSEQLRSSEQPFLNLMGLPQEVEGIIRGHALHAIVMRLNRDLPNPASGGVDSVAVLIFTGALLGIGDEQLLLAVEELFGSQLSGNQLATCKELVASLARLERQAGADNARTDVAGMIRGEGNQYATLWESGKGP